MKIKFVNIVMAWITQKKLKSYISIAIPFENEKENFIVGQCCSKDEKAMEGRSNN